MFCFAKLLTKQFVKKIKVLQPVPLEYKKIPQQYKGVYLSDKNQCVALMNDQSMLGKRGQRNGLVYATKQMPGRSKLKNKGWNIVIRKPTDVKARRGYASEITTPDGTIQVEFLRHEIPASIIKSVTHFMANHAPTRNFDGESGVMVAAGMRVDTTSSAKMLYVPSKNNNNATAGRSTVFLRDASLDFNDMLSKTCCNDVLQKDLQVLKNESNVLVFPSSNNSTNVCVHPSYAISHNLTNSIHCDVNDNSRSFAVFYPSKKEDSCTWFLFPTYNIAIQCSDRVVISWNGRKMKHCSCTESGNVWSFFASSNKDVTRHCNIEKAFQKRKYNDVSIGDIIYTRRQLRNMKFINYIDPNAVNHPNKWMYRMAKVLKRGENKEQVTIQFVANLKKLGEISFHINHVCRLDIVQCV